MLLLFKVVLFRPLHVHNCRELLSCNSLKLYNNLFLWKVWFDIRLLSAQNLVQIYSSKTLLFLKNIENSIKKWSLRHYYSTNWCSTNVLSLFKKFYFLWSFYKILQVHPFSSSTLVEQYLFLLFLMGFSSVFFCYLFLNRVFEFCLYFL